MNVCFLPSALAFLCMATTAAQANADTSATPAASEIETRVQDTEVERILALSDDVDYGEYLAGECSSCHSETINKDSNVPVIHGSTPANLVKALLEYRVGIRNNTSMEQVANGLDDESMAAIAHYLAISGH